MNTIGDISSKKDLIALLISLREAAIYDIFAQTCLHEFIKKWHHGEADPTSLKTELPEGIINLQQFILRLTNYGNNTAVETKRNANRSTTRNLLKEGFRITQSFCKNNNINHIMKSMPWYQFTRIIVNSLSHDFRLNFNRYDLQQLPVTFNNYSIEITDNGKSLSMPLSVLMSLYDKIFKFVEDEII